ncbi:MAG: hypothetical protein JW822_06575, partial [Spirochaetales bacterium]|nr:hypothetical protein [Spirochaetales bacterium]
LCYVIPLVIITPALLCALDLSKNTIILIQLILAAVIFLVHALAFIRPYKHTLKSLKTNKTNGEPLFADIMTGCYELKDRLERTDLENKISSIHQEAENKVTTVQKDLQLFKTEVDSALLPIFKIFYEKENDMSICDKMSCIIDELHKSIEYIVQKMKNQSELLTLTFDAFDTTTLSLERVDTIIEKAKGLSGYLQKETLKGREALAQTRESMKAILESSEKMVRIIATIEDISEQTNILSINASIESTHADKSGKGFSVIAKEIRTLASNTKNSSIEIRQMIEDMIQKTKKQTELGEILFNIFKQINIYIEQTNQTNKDIYNISKKGVIQGREMQTAINALGAIAKEIITASDKELNQANELLDIMISAKQVIDNIKNDREFLKSFQEQAVFSEKTDNNSTE